jgi:hypothetical protein
MAQRCPRALVAQSFAFPASYGVAQAQAWLRRHKLAVPPVARTATQLRFRQRDPATCQRGNFATIPMGATGIQQVLCCPKARR